ncbi:hypothetical protein CSUI_005428 [Cystoisospora suis]|uniref:Uncharacterized protein n=1 Tax=Cystoisospora suis TaxID=483139 RepID=A0A2C6KTS1_9APIC|nr:hypothetical protein CSUI_005428 [Cystoisospora suis]
MRLLSRDLVFLLPLLHFFLLFSYSWFLDLLALSACLRQDPLVVLTPNTSNAVIRPRPQKAGEKVLLSPHAPPCPSRSFHVPLPLFYARGFRGLAAFQGRSHSFRTEKTWRASVPPLLVQQLDSSDLFGALLLCSLHRGNFRSRTRPCIVAAGRGGNRVKHRHRASEEKNTTALPAFPFLSVFAVLVSVLASPSHQKSRFNRNGTEGGRRSEKEQRSFSTVFPFSVFSWSPLSLRSLQNEEPSAAFRKPGGTVERRAHLFHGHPHENITSAMQPRAFLRSGRLPETKNIEERTIMYQDKPVGAKSRHRRRFARLSTNGVGKRRSHRWELSCFAVSHCRQNERALMEKHLRGCQPCLSQGLRADSGECVPWRDRSVRKQPRRRGAKLYCFVGLDLVKIFGRLTDISTVGSVVASPVASPALAAREILAVYEHLAPKLSKKRKDSESVEFPAAGKEGSHSGSRRRNRFSPGFEQNSSVASHDIGESTAAFNVNVRQTEGGAESASPPLGRKNDEPSSQIEPGAIPGWDWEAWLASEQMKWLSSTQESMLVQKTGALKRRGTLNRGRASCAPRKKWELLFLPKLQQGRRTDREEGMNDGEESEGPSRKNLNSLKSTKPGPALDRKEFEEKLMTMKFAWPLQPNAGAALCPTIQYMPAAYSVFLEVARGLDDPRNGGEEDFSGISSSPDGSSDGLHRKSRARRKSVYERVGTALQNSPIAADAIDCVWRALTRVIHGPYGEVLPLGVPLPHPDLYILSPSNPSRRLCRGDMLRCIWEWAPADGLVDWESFLFFLDQVPADGAERLLN